MTKLMGKKVLMEDFIRYQKSTFISHKVRFHRPICSYYRRAPARTKLSQPRNFKAFIDIIDVKNLSNIYTRALFIFDRTCHDTAKISENCDRDRNDT